jgi:hypothetical protein
VSVFFLHSLEGSPSKLRKAHLNGYLTSSSPGRSTITLHGLDQSDTNCNRLNRNRLKTIGNDGFTRTSWAALAASHELLTPEKRPPWPGGSSFSVILWPRPSSYY